MQYEPHPITHAQGLLEGVLRSLDKVDEVNKEGLKRVLVEVVGLLKEVDKTDYWKTRCALAEKCMEESPCDPDITKAQISAHREYELFLKDHHQ